jgi:uncharacterized membrane protein YozB (DUF420 family)
MYKTFVVKNQTTSSIILFLILFLSICFFKPKFLYNTNGSIRNFGIGYKNKTIMPIWLLAIILGIFSYLAIMYFSHSHFI